MNLQQIQTPIEIQTKGIVKVLQLLQLVQSHDIVHSILDWKESKQNHTLESPHIP